MVPEMVFEHRVDLQLDVALDCVQVEIAFSWLYLSQNWLDRSGHVLDVSFEYVQEHLNVVLDCLASLALQTLVRNGNEEPDAR